MTNKKIIRKRNRINNRLNKPSIFKVQSIYYQVIKIVWLIIDTREAFQYKITLWLIKAKITYQFSKTINLF